MYFPTKFTQSYLCHVHVSVLSSYIHKQCQLHNHAYILQLYLSKQPPMQDFVRLHFLFCSKVKFSSYVCKKEVAFLIETIAIMHVQLALQLQLASQLVCIISMQATHTHMHVPQLHHNLHYVCYTKLLYCNCCDHIQYICIPQSGNISLLKNFCGY